MSDRAKQDALEKLGLLWPGLDVDSTLEHAVYVGDLYSKAGSLALATECLETIVSGADIGSSCSIYEFRLLVGLARVFGDSGELQEAREICQRASSIADEIGVPVAYNAELLVVRAWTEVKSGAHPQAVAYAGEAYDLLRNTADHEVMAEAAKCLGIAYANLGEMSLAKDYFSDSLATYRRLSNLPQVAAVLNNLGLCSKNAAEYDSATGYFLRSLDIEKQLKNEFRIAQTKRNLGTVYIKRGEWLEAEELFAEALSSFEELDNPLERSRSLIALGNLRRLQRRWSESHKLLTKAERIAKRHDFARERALAMQLIGALSLDRGQTGKATTVLESVRPHLEEIAPKGDLAVAWHRRYSELMVVVGEFEEALSSAERAVTMAKRLGDRQEVALARRALAVANLASGNTTPAKANIDSALDELRAIGSRYQTARTLLVSAEVSLAGKLRDPVDAEAWLNEAELVFRRLDLEYWLGRLLLSRTKLASLEGKLEKAGKLLGAADVKLKAFGTKQDLTSLKRARSDLDRKLSAEAYAGGSIQVVGDLYRNAVGVPVTRTDFTLLGEKVARHLKANRMFLLVGTDRTRICLSYNISSAVAMRLVEFLALGKADSMSDAPLVLSRVSGRFGNYSFFSVPSSVVFYPVTLHGERYGLYVERKWSEISPGFNPDEIDFIAASAGLLGEVHNRLGTEADWTKIGHSYHDMHVGLGSRKLITRDARMLELLKLVERLRDSTSPVLLLGETGVGKELFARAIHEGGRSRHGEFVFFHPSGRPSNLFESELFGYVKGAFTGADKDTKGLVAEADSGTLFLDEIGEMSEDLQTKLLRLLESGEYRRLGETAVRNADIRIVSATNKDLATAVKDGAFRKDLFYRLAAVTLEIPPLRERPDDIPALAEYFLAEFSKIEGRSITGISPEVMRVLMAWDWPGNVRELQNEIRRAVALADSDSEITLDLLSPRIITALEGSSVDRPLQQEMEALQRRRILQALSSADWNKNHAAKRLGLKRTTLLAKMKRLGISR